MPQQLPVGQHGSDDDLKGYSCLTCRQRKVKCDRRNPCTNCVKVEKQCSFVAPIRGKRKKTKPPREGLHAKLKRYEELLKSYGAKVEVAEEDDESDLETATPSHPDVEMRDEDATQHQDHEDRGEIEAVEPKLIANSNTSRYVESALWNNLGDEMGARLLLTTFAAPSSFPPSDQPHENGAVDESIRKSNVHHNGLFFETGPNLNPPSLTSLRPSFQLLLRLRDIYIDRVDQLIKIIHPPTFWSTLTKAVQHSEDLPASLEAILFAICLAAISTLQEDECHNIFGQSSSVVRGSYSVATQQALAKAQLLSTTNLLTLQAFSIFIICVRNTYNSDTLYALSGIAIRLARKMGLHRDGISLGLPPFETEMRRRFWWHLVLVDIQTADVLGTRPSLDLSSGDTRFPLNVEDDDLKPDMIDPPSEHNGITDATLCRLKCELMETLKKFSPTSDGDLRWEVLHNSNMALSEKDNVIKQLEDSLESKYLRYCDPSNTLHTLVSVTIRSTICKLKLFAHNPRRFANDPSKVSESERHIVFTNAMKLLEYATFMRSTSSGLQKYMWQVGTSYLWNTMLYLLIEMRHRKTGFEVDKSWQLIGVVFSRNPQVFEETPEPAFVALSKWTLEVWDEYIAASKAEGLPEPLTPEYISNIQRVRKPVVEQATETHELPIIDPFESYGFPDLLSFQMDPNEWSQWEQLIAGQGGL